MGNTAEELLLRIQGDSSSGQQAVQQLADVLSSALAKALTDVKRTTDDSAQATSALKKYFDDLTPSTQNAHAAFTDLKSTLTGFWENPTQELGNFAKALSTELAPALGAIGVAAGITVGAFAAIGAVSYQLADQTAKVGAAIQDVTYKTGASAPVISTWRGSLEIAGGSLDQFGSALFMMQRRMIEGGPQFQQGLERIGATMNELQALQPDQQFLRIAQGIQAIPDPAARAAAAMELFGRPGRELLPLIMKNLGDLNAESERLGSTWTEQDAKAAEQFEMQTRALSLALGNAKDLIGKELIPLLQKPLELATGSIGWLLTSPTSPLGVAIDSLKQIKALLDAMGHAGVGGPVGMVGAFLSTPVASGPPPPGAPKAFADAGGSAGFDQSTAAMQAQTVAAANLEAHLQSLRDKSATLTATQQAQAKIMLEAGDPIEKITADLNAAYPQFQVTTEAVKTFSEALDYNKKYTAEWTEAVAALTPILQSPAWDGSYQSMLKLGGSVHDTSIYFGMLKGDVEVAATAIKNVKQIEADYTAMHLATMEVAKKADEEFAKARTALLKTVNDTLAQQFLSEQDYATRRVSLYETSEDAINREWAQAIGKLGAPLQGFEAQWQRTVDSINAYFDDKWFKMTTDAKVKADAKVWGEEIANSFETGFNNILDGLPNVISQALTGGGGLSGGLQAVAGQVGSLFGKKLFDVTSPVNGIISDGLSHVIGDSAAGALSVALPGIGSAIGSLVGPALNALMNIGGPSKDELAARDTFAKQFKDANDMLAQVSAAGVVLGKNGEEVRAMAQRVLDATHESAAAEAAALKDVNDLLDQAKNRTAQLADTMAGFTKGLSVPAAALKSYDDLNAQQQALNVQISQTTDPNQLASLKKQLADVMSQLNQAGTLYDVTRVKSQESASAIAASIVGITNANMKAGMSFTDAVKAAQPAVQALEAQLQATGFTGGKAFDFLRQEVDLANDAIAGPALQSIHGYTQGLQGLSAAGLLDQQTFSGLASQISGTETALLKQGYSASTVSVAMQGDLQTLWEMEQKYGYSADDTTQALIDQGVQSGLIGEQGKSDNQKILDVLVAIGDALGAKIPSALETFKKTGTDAANAVAGAMNGIPTDIDTTVHVSTDGTGASGGAAAPAVAAAQSSVTETADHLNAWYALPFDFRINTTFDAWVKTTYGSHGGWVTPEGIQYLEQGSAQVDRLAAAAARGSDTVPAMLTPGEAVLTKAAASTLGRGTIAALNSGSSARMEAATRSAGAGSGVIVNVNVQGSIWKERDLAETIGRQLTKAFLQRGGALPLGTT